MIKELNKKGDKNMAKDMSTMDWVAFVLVMIGGLNWGLMAFGYDLFTGIFGSFGWLVTTVYALVGLSTLYMIYSATQM